MLWHGYKTLPALMCVQGEMRVSVSGTFLQGDKTDPTCQTKRRMSLTFGRTAAIEFHPKTVSFHDPAACQHSSACTAWYTAYVLPWQQECQSPSSVLIFALLLCAVCSAYMPTLVATVLPSICPLRVPVLHSVGYGHLSSLPGQEPTTCAASCSSLILSTAAHA